MLERSYAVGEHLVPEERGWLDWRLAEVAGQHYRQLTISFTKDGLRSAGEAPRTWNRLALQKNLLVALATVDPAEAIRQLGTLEPPVSTAAGTFPEDVRSHAAKLIFLAYLKKRGANGLPTVTRVAHYLGETGQYPYAAIGAIIHSGIPPSAATALASTSVERYRTPSKFQRETKDFIEFLQLAEGKVPASILREGGRLALDRLRSNSQQTSGKFLAAIRSKTESVTLTSETQVYLAELLPILQLIDPESISKELKSDPTTAALLRVTSEPHHLEATMLHTEEQPAPQAQLRGIERSRLSTIRVIASEKPAQAAALADELTIPPFRVAGLARAAGGYSNQERKEGLALLTRAANEWEKLESASAKLSAGAEIVDAAQKLKETSIFRQMFGKLFAIGEELVSEQLDAKPAALLADCEGFDELSQLANLGSRFDPAWTYEEVSAVRNDALKAFLLAEMADGLLADLTAE
ncbi:MAG: hypothetical protein ACRD3A_08775 [Terriglobales bacterium]